MSNYVPVQSYHLHLLDGYDTYERKRPVSRTLYIPAKTAQRLIAAGFIYVSPTANPPLCAAQDDIEDMLLALPGAFIVKVQPDIEPHRRG